MDQWADPHIWEPEYYEYPEEDAHIFIIGKRYRIPVLPDSGLNIFLINRHGLKMYRSWITWELMQFKFKVLLEKLYCLAEQISPNYS